MNFNRILDIDLPPGQSAFLWGARKSGKTTFLKNKFPESLRFDFLQTDTYLDFLKTPSLLRERILAKTEHTLHQPIILDEVQKVPHILDEVHWLIENRGLSFVLCGSSARKLKRGQANLLGGRAWRYQMHPLTYAETGETNLLRILNQGLIPSHYAATESHCRRSLKAYVSDYLIEEIFQEGLTRNIQAFSRFFDALGQCQGELINYTNIARDCGVDAKTVREYFYILEDTLVGSMLYPYRKRKSREIITQMPKFYLFDVGVGGYLSRRVIPEEKGEQFGRAFEHFIYMELQAYNLYAEMDMDICYWRTKAGHEVDFILGDEICIEIKGSGMVKTSDLKGIVAFKEELKPRRAIIVCNEKEPRLCGDISILPWRIFLEELWSGDIVR
jgi:predicted AAA+ superfamily ATPase